MYTGRYTCDLEASFHESKEPASLGSLETGPVGMPALFWIQIAIVLLGKYPAGYFAMFPSLPAIIAALRSSGRGFSITLSFLFFLQQSWVQQTTTCTLIYFTSGKNKNWPRGLHVSRKDKEYFFFSLKWIFQSGIFQTFTLSSHPLQAFDFASPALSSNSWKQWEVFHKYSQKFIIIYLAPKGSRNDKRFY